ncbi:transcription initiation factor IIA gamma subunit [Mycena crocata]|nr:transcription initiation factor IIA gamma subunit [Mycena crocata]
MATIHYEVYRGSSCAVVFSLGTALCDSLDSLIQSGAIDEKVAKAVLAQFDRVVAEAITAKVKAKATVKGHLKTYRHCEEVWRFGLRNVTFKMDNKQTVTTARVEMIACKAGGVVEAEMATPETSPVKTSPVKRYLVKKEKR